MVRGSITILAMSIFSFVAGCGYAPAPANFQLTDKTLFARGWTESELQKIIADFEQMYSDRLPSNFSTRVEPDERGVLRISFPNDIEPRFFCWLLNYVQYPKDLDFRSRNIFVAGTATIAADFLPTSGESLVGKRILFYIPTHDKDYDLVYGRVDHQSYEYPFSSERWRAAADPRLPDDTTEISPPNHAIQRTADRRNA
jgi:hypothetical protein